MDALPLWDNWLMMAWSVPLALAVSALIDVLLVGRRIFTNAFEAAAISGVLGVLPFLLLPLWSEASLFPAPTTVATAVLAGALYSCHLLYYFKALFRANDVAHAEAFLSLAVLAVPVLSFVLFGERLQGEHYVGIGIATAGVATLTLSGGRALLAKRSITGLLTAALLTVSLSLLLQDVVFQHCDYWIGTFWFAVGAIVCALCFAWRSGHRRALRTVRENKGTLLATNVTALVALAASLRATDLSESVSLVIVIETATPIVIMALALAALGLAPLWRTLSPTVASALREQLDDAPIKIGSMSMILMGVVLVSMP